MSKPSFARTSFDLGPSLSSVLSRFAPVMRSRALTYSFAAAMNLSRVIYALTLQASASKADTTYANQLKSAAMLEKLYEQNPQHPGVSHFIIHAYDFPPLAEKGLAAARRYAGIAPAVPHARH